jgi:hypothetical protein
MLLSIRRYRELVSITGLLPAADGSDQRPGNVGSTAAKREKKGREISAIVKIIFMQAIFKWGAPKNQRLF